MPSRTTVATVVNPRDASSATVAAAAPPATTGTLNRDPAVARTVFGLVGSTVPSQHTTASTPAASAVRITVPRLPGSLTSTQTTTSVASSRDSGSAGA